MTKEKKVNCPNCWKENSTSNLRCEFCGVPLQDFEDEKFPKPKKKKFVWKKKYTKIILGVIIGGGLLAVAITWLYGNYHNSFFGIHEDEVVSFNESTLILTLKITVSEGKIKVQKILVYDLASLELLGEEQFNYVIEANQQKLFHIKLTSMPESNSLRIEIDKLRGYRGFSYYIGANLRFEPKIECGNLFKPSSYLVETSPS